MSVARLFRDHPASVGETYRQHMRVALGFAGPLAMAAAAAGVHALFPFLFKTTASGTVRKLNERMTRRCVACPSGPAHRPDLFGALPVGEQMPTVRPRAELGLPADPRHSG